MRDDISEPSLWDWLTQCTLIERKKKGKKMYSDSARPGRQWCWMLVVGAISLNLIASTASRYTSFDAGGASLVCSIHQDRIDGLKNEMTSWVVLRVRFSIYLFSFLPSSSSKTSSRINRRAKWSIERMYTRSSTYSTSTGCSTCAQHCLPPVLFYVLCRGLTFPGSIIKTQTQTQTENWIF